MEIQTEDKPKPQNQDYEQQTEPLESRDQETQIHPETQDNRDRTNSSTMVYNTPKPNSASEHGDKLQQVPETNINLALDFCDQEIEAPMTQELKDQETQFTPTERITNKDGKYSSTSNYKPKTDQQLLLEQEQLIQQQQIQEIEKESNTGEKGMSEKPKQQQHHAYEVEFWDAQQQQNQNQNQKAEGKVLVHNTSVDQATQYTPTKKSNNKDIKYSSNSQYQNQFPPAPPIVVNNLKNSPFNTPQQTLTQLQGKSQSMITRSPLHRQSTELSNIERMKMSSSNRKHPQKPMQPNELKADHQIVNLSISPIRERQPDEFENSQTNFSNGSGLFKGDFEDYNTLQNILLDQHYNQKTQRRIRQGLFVDQLERMIMGDRLNKQSSRDLSGSNRIAYQERSNFQPIQYQPAQYSPAVQQQPVFKVFGGRRVSQQVGVKQYSPKALLKSNKVDYIARYNRQR